VARLWKQVIKGEKGQALPMVLILLVLGGLLIAPSLSYVSTSLNAGHLVEKNLRGVLAADAGVENALWCLKNSISPPGQLPENVNQMQVAIETEDRGHYALYDGKLVDVRDNHYDWLAVDREMVWDEVAEAYQYTITVTWQPEVSGNIKLEEVGVRLPIGYSYQPGSAFDFDLNLSRDKPDDTLDGAGAHMLNWELGSPRPELSQEQPTATQTFHVTGEGEQEGDYTWVEAVRMDIWVVSDVSGILYRITATATGPEDGKITATVMADAILNEGTGEIYIILWQINPQ